MPKPSPKDGFGILANNKHLCAFHFPNYESACILRLTMMKNTQTLQDHLGRTLTAPVHPQRIVSLCPSQTSTLFYLGLDSRIVGRTNFCIHPEPQIAKVKKIGGTKKIRFQDLDNLEPDLIIAEKEENTPEMVASLAEKYPVYVTDVRDMSSSLQMIRDLGHITGKSEAGEQLAADVQQAFSGLLPLARPQRCAYLIWRKPWMAAGNDTFIHAMLTACGFENVAADWPGRYPEFSLDDLVATAPDCILLSSEPFPFAQAHLTEIAAILPKAKIRLVDGEMFSWYGNHMLKAPTYFQALLGEF